AKRRRGGGDGSRDGGSGGGEPVEAATRPYLPEPADRGPGVGHRDVHADGGRGGAGGGPEQPSAVHRADSDGFGVAVFSAGAAGRGDRRYFRPAPADPGHRILDAGDRRDSGGSDDCGGGDAVALAAANAGAFAGRRGGSADVAGDISGAGEERGSDSGAGAEWNRIQPGASGGARPRGVRHRGSGGGDGVHTERGVVSGSDRRDRAVEA